MTKHAPMDVLRDLTEKELTKTTTRLGRARQAHVQESSRLELLETYASQYRQQLQNTIVDGGISILALQTHQNFLASLDHVVAQQVRQVSASQERVDDMLAIWKRDKQRANAFNTLKNRAETQKLIKENRLEQKMMDEFARRVSQRKT